MERKKEPIVVINQKQEDLLNNIICGERKYGQVKPTENIYNPVIIKKGQGDTEGNPSIEIQFAGCFSEIMGDMLNEREIECFKKGILAEQERVWDRLADILDKNELDKIKYEELFNH